MVSIVIVTFNSLRFIGPCLDSIFRQDLHGCEVIIIDNASTDGTIGFLKKNYPDLRIIENTDNLGPAVARNQGIAIAIGNWILCLDSDVILRDDFIKCTWEIINNLPVHVGSVQPKILKTGKKTIFSAGIHLSFLKKFYDIGKDNLDGDRFNSSRLVFGVCSAAALYCKAMLNDIKDRYGYFDERYFFLVEDVDLSWRAKQKKWETLYFPGLVCYHDGNGSSTKKSHRQYYCWRNRKILLSKMHLNLAVLSAIYLMYDLPRLVFLFIFNPNVRREIKKGLLKGY